MTNDQMKVDILPHLIDIPTLAEHLAVTIRHVRRLLAEESLPCHKVGHLVRFDPANMTHWLDERRVWPPGWAGVARRREQAVLPSLINLATVAEHLGVTQRHIRRLIAERRIPFLRVGRLIRFEPAELAAWLEDRCGGRQSA